VGPSHRIEAATALTWYNLKDNNIAPTTRDCSSETYYPVYPTVAGYWDYYRTSWPGRGNDEESTR